MARDSKAEHRRPALRNPRHERFAQELAKGASQVEAYANAGYSADRSCASRLAAKANIVSRIAEIRAEADAVDREALELATERLAISKERVLAELATIGFANMADYMRIGSLGDPELHFAELTRDQSAALAEVTVEDFKEGRGRAARDVRRVKFKLHDKRAALVDLGKHLGLFVDRIDHNVNVRDVSDEPLTAGEWAERHVTQH